LNFLYNHFNGPTKLFSNLFKFLDILTKSFFPCNKRYLTIRQHLRQFTGKEWQRDIGERKLKSGLIEFTVF